MLSKAKLKWSLLCLGLMGMMSCSAPLQVHDVVYQSARSERHAELMPKTSLDATTASILVEPVIDFDGNINVYVTNLTDSIMTIDRTKSFYVSPAGTSTIYYDPTVHTQSNSHTSGGTKGMGVNLGAIGNALGVGGAVGQILNGVNVGGSKQNSNTVTNTTYTIDTPTGAIAPHGKASMGRTFVVTGLGREFCKDLSQKSYQDINQSYDSSTSYCKFGVCISYSIDNGKSFRKIVSNFYANTAMLSKVKEKGKVNDALRAILMGKKNALDEPWYMFKFNSNITSADSYSVTSLYDYQ